MPELTTPPQTADLAATVRKLATAPHPPTGCPHPPARLFTWWAYDGSLCAGCCECGAVLAGAAEEVI